MEFNYNFKYRKNAEFQEDQKYHYLSHGIVRWAFAKKDQRGRFYAFRRSGCVPVYLDTVLTYPFGMEEVIKMLDLLPETHDEIDWDKRPHFYVPSIPASDCSTAIFSKDAFHNWKHEFILRYREYPELRKAKLNDNVFEVINRVFCDAQSAYVEGKGAWLGKAGTTE